MAVLDKDGVIHFWNKIKAKLDGKANASHNHSIGEITDLKGTLDGKVSAATYSTDMSNKANIDHTHAFASLTENPISITPLSSGIKLNDYSSLTLDQQSSITLTANSYIYLDNANVKIQPSFYRKGDATVSLSKEAGILVGGTNVSLNLKNIVGYVIACIAIYKSQDGTVKIDNFKIQAHQAYKILNIEPLTPIFVMWCKSV